MRLTAELLTRHVLSPRMTHSAIGSESCNVREMFTAPYPVVVFPLSLYALYKSMNMGVCEFREGATIPRNNVRHETG
jgi:hypothetical protein